MQKWECGNCGRIIEIPIGIVPDENGCPKNSTTGKHAWYKIY